MPFSGCDGGCDAEPSPLASLAALPGPNSALSYGRKVTRTSGTRVVAELLSFTSWLDWDLDKHALDAGELSLAGGSTKVAALGNAWSGGLAW